jgi:hypothetical protein
MSRVSVWERPSRAGIVSINGNVITREQALSAKSVSAVADGNLDQTRFIEKISGLQAKAGLCGPVTDHHRFAAVAWTEFRRLQFCYRDKDIGRGGRPQEASASFMCNLGGRMDA